MIGVIPQALMDREVGHEGLTELLIVQTMHQRKHAMAERADAFLALPGGIGTLEELYEMWSWQQLGHHDKPLALLNTGGYYRHLLAFMDQSVQRGFVSAQQREALLVGDDAGALVQQVLSAARVASGPDNYSLF